MDVRLHEELSVSGRAESAREAVEMDLPPFDKAYEQLVYLASLYAALGTVLGGNIHQNPYFSASGRGVAALKRKRTALLRLMLEHDDTLGSAEDAGRVSGWNRLMLTWIIICQITLCLQRLDADDPMATAQETHHILVRNELLTTPGGMADVPIMSLNELRKAIDLLRDRLFMIDEPGLPLFSYVMALEQRAAAFVCGFVPNSPTGKHTFIVFSH